MSDRDERLIDPFAQLDAAYALGALDTDDLAAFEAHLRSCADCRARVDDLRPTVQLLAAARADGGTLAALEAGPPPDTLLPGLLRRATQERTRRRRITAAIGVVAAACLVALVIAVWPSSTPARPAPQALEAVAISPVQATVRLVAKPWGTEIDVHCKYARDAAARYPDYALRVIDRDNTTQTVGAWSLAPSGTVDFTGGTAIRRERIAKVQITLPNGTPILQLSL